MNKILVILILQLFIVIHVSQAEDFFCTNDSGQLLEYKKSIDPSQAPGNCTMVAEKDTAATRILITQNNLKFLKNANGEVSVMSQAEQDNIVAQETAIIASSKTAAIQTLKVPTLDIMRAALDLLSKKGVVITEQEFIEKVAELSNQ